MSVHLTQLGLLISLGRRPDAAFLATNFLNLSSQRRRVSSYLGEAPMNVLINGSGPQGIKVPPAPYRYLERVKAGFVLFSHILSYNQRRCDLACHY